MGRRPFPREGEPRALQDHDRARLGGLSRSSAGHGARVGGRQLLRPAQFHLSVRRLYLRRRCRRRHRRHQGAALLRARRLRHAHQPDDHRGPGAWRLDRSLRHRHGPGDPLRRRRQRDDGVAPGLLPADGGRDAELGDRLYGDAVAAPPDRRQGRRREPECRRRAVLRQRRQRRLQVPRLDPHRHAARPLAHLDRRRKAWPPWMTPDRDRIAERLAAVGYVADRDLATALWLMDFLKRPLLLEGEAGVGKTEVAKALAAVHQAELIRLQCYEGLDQNAALYEWNYQRQLLAIKAREGDDAERIEEHIFSEKYLLERPLLAAIRRERPPVLLVDEVDRADEEFEAFLLEVLSDFQVTI